MIGQRLSIFLYEKYKLVKADFSTFYWTSGNEGEEEDEKKSLSSPINNRDDEMGVAFGTGPVP